MDSTGIEACARLGFRNWGADGNGANGDTVGWEGEDVFERGDAFSSRVDTEPAAS